MKNELESRLSAGADPFWDIVVYLDRQRNPLDFAVPSTWKKYINRASPTSIRDILAGTVVFMLFASLILWFRPSYFIGCAGEKLELNSRMYCLTNREDSILLKRHAIIRFVQQGDTKGLNNLLIQAYRQMDTTDSRLLFETAAISWYNQGVYYREGDLDTSNVSTASLEKACFCFQQVVKIKNTYLPDYLFPKIDRAISNCQLQ